MRLADFQNPIANMPLLQQMQQSQQSSQNAVPVFVSQLQRKEESEKRNTVNESKEQEENNHIADHEDRHHSQHQSKNKSSHNDSNFETEQKATINDGIHGTCLDVQA